MDAPVVDLAAYVKALRARDALDKVLVGWGWFLRAEVEVQSSRIVVLAITTVACSSDVRRDIYVCIPSHVNGFPVETRAKNARSAQRPPCEARAVLREGREGKPE